MTLQEQRDMIQAAIDGKQVESRVLDGPWLLVLAPATPVNYHFDFQRSEYRVKPQPREWWLVRSGMCDCGSPEVHGFHAYTDKDRGGEKGAIHVREVLDE